MPGVKEIIKEAELLPVEERTILINSLLQTLNPPEPKVDRKWAKLAKQRLEELRSGRVSSIPGDQVFAEVRKRFGK